MYIINLESNGDKLVLNVSPSLHAMKYEIEVSHNDEVVYQTTSESEKISLNEFYPEYANDYSINVQAVNKNNEKKDSQNTFNYQNLEPSIDKTEKALAVEKLIYAFESNKGTINDLSFVYGYVEGTVDNYTVTAHIYTRRDGVLDINVRATKYLISNADVAQKVIDKYRNYVR